MKKESHGATRRDMVVGLGRLIESGKDGVYSFGKSFARVCITEEDIGARMIEIEGREAKLRGWESGVTHSPVTVLDIRAPDRALGTL